MQQYLETLRRVPDSIVRRVAGRQLDMYDPNKCICGWVLRETLATMKDTAVRNIDVQTLGVAVPVQCSRIFGGTAEEWDAIYTGVMDGRKAPVIEAAFATRCREV